MGSPATGIYERVAVFQATNTPFSVDNLSIEDVFFTLNLRPPTLWERDSVPTRLATTQTGLSGVSFQADLVLEVSTNFAPPAAFGLNPDAFSLNATNLSAGGRRVPVVSGASPGNTVTLRRTQVFVGNQFNNAAPIVYNMGVFHDDPLIVATVESVTVILYSNKLTP